MNSAARPAPTACLCPYLRACWILIALLMTLPASAGHTPGWSSGSGNTIVRQALGTGFNVVLKADGTVVAWGTNEFGQCAVPPGLSQVVAVAAGESHAMALKADGTVVCWGRNEQGQSTVPPGLANVVAIAAGYAHSLALRSDGTVVAWGWNLYGQTSVPAGLNNVVAIGAGYLHSMALKADGTLAGWGNNQWGESAPPSGLSGVKGLSLNFESTLALKADGSVAAWGGRNQAGELNVPGALAKATAIGAGGWFSSILEADGTLSIWGQGFDVSKASNVVTLSAGRNHLAALNGDGTLTFLGNAYYNGETTLRANWNLGVCAAGAGATHSLALKADGTVVGWGTASAGELTIPPGLSNVGAIAVSARHDLALRADGTVIAWGDDTFGQSTVPPGLAGVDAIAAGGTFSAALKADGTVTAWGDDSASQVTGASSLQSVKALALGASHGLALRADGAVVAWGANGNGQASVSAGARGGVVAVAAGDRHSAALKADGTVDVWGDDTLGLVTFATTISHAKAIASGPDHMLALLANGTVVAWGRNDSGQCSVPSNLAQVISIAAGDQHSLAVKADGTVVGWGPGVLLQTTVPTSSVALSSDAATADPGADLTLQATVDGHSGSLGVVTFVADDMDVLGTAPVDATGRATLVTRGLAPGTHVIRAVYTKDPGRLDSKSDPLSVRIKTPATVTLGGLSQTYTGDAHYCTAATSPAGLGVVFTYKRDGNLVPNPTLAGSYEVTATIEDATYSGSATGTLVIAKATATVTLDGLSQIYTGSAKAITAATSPSGLAVDVTYDGARAAPSDAGSYAVVATVNDANHQGMATGTLVIAKAAATVTLGGLSQIHSGTGRQATATTNPPGLAVAMAYAQGGSPVASPTAVGSYEVTATVNDTNYAGGATGTLVILPPQLNLALGTPSLTVVTGGKASGSLTLSANGLPLGAVALTVSGLPANTTLAFSRTSVAPDQFPVTLAFEVKASSDFQIQGLQAPVPGEGEGWGRGLGLGSILAGGLLPAPWILRRKGSSGRPPFFLLALLVAVLGGLAACGGSQGGSSSTGITNGTPPGTYDLTITAAGAGMAPASSTFKLTVTR